MALCYVSTAIGHGAIGLRTPCAVRYCHRVSPDSTLRACYAMPGANKVYGATRFSSTAIAYGAKQCPVPA
eukprot:1366120-Rhodomonas_salina.3